VSILLPERWLLPLQLHSDREMRLARGDGAYVWDDEGNKYLDLDTNGGVNVLGHAHPAMTSAVVDQLSRLGSAHEGFETDAREEFIEAISLIVPEPLTHVSFANSGSEAVETALKLARGVTGRPRFIAMTGAFHGTTFGAMAVSGDRRVHESLAPMLPEVRRVPYGDIEALEAAMNQRVAAVILEPVQWAAGVRVATPQYLADVAQQCRANGSLLIFDEVQSALRTWPALVSAGVGVVPDLLCLGPSIANGFPLGATAIREGVAQRTPNGLPGSTVAANPLACAAGTATLRTIADPSFRARVAAAGDYFMRRLSALRMSDIKEVRGRGLMAAVELSGNARPVIQNLRLRGVLVIPSVPRIIRLLPPLTLDRREIDLAVEALAAAVLDARQARRRRATETDAEEITLPGYPTNPHAAGREREV